MTSSAVWFAPAPSRMEMPRATVDFGLRAAETYFSQLVAPGIGRVWFGRQITWSLAALAMHEMLQSRGLRTPPPTAIAQGLEALSAKLAVVYGKPTERVLRHHGDDTNDKASWSFKHLCEPNAYVQNPHRRAALRALRADGGLALTQGRRYNQMTLEPIGREMAHAWLRQRAGGVGKTVGQTLVAWLCGEYVIPHRPMGLVAAMAPEGLTAEERTILEGRLFGTTGEAAEVRRHLAQALEEFDTLPDLETDLAPRLRAQNRTVQASQVIATMYFGRLMNAAKRALMALTQGVAKQPKGLALHPVLRDLALQTALDDAVAAAKGFRSHATPAEIEAPALTSWIEGMYRSSAHDAVARSLFQRVPHLVALHRGVMFPGPAFRVVASDEAERASAEGVDAAEPDRGSFGIAHFHSLLQDMRAGARRG